jgi:hypothetical protein
MAVSFIQAVLIDSTRPEAWSALQQYFNSRPDGAGALIYDRGQVKLNVSNPLVRMHLCSAYRDFIRILRNARKFDLAVEARKSAVDKYGFPASLFDPLFDEPLYPVTPDGVQYDKPIPAPAKAKLPQG